MNRIDENRKAVMDQVKKFEKTAHEMHELADTVHKKMEKLHAEATASRKRAHAVRMEQGAKAKRSRSIAPKIKKTKPA